MTDLFTNLYLPGADQTKLNPTFGQTMKSAFGQENDLVNFYDYLTTPVHKPDLNFDFKSTFNKDKLPLDWQPLLADTRSEPEYRAKLGKIQQEYKDKAVLAASGWSGTVAAIGAGILSPVSFLPIVGQGQKGWAIAEMIGLAAAGSTAQNAALFLNQATRTEAELYSGIAFDTLMGGMLGGAWLGLSREGKARLRGDLAYNQAFAQVPVGALDVPTGKTISAQVGDVGDEFTGTIRALHGYSGRDTVGNFGPGYNGARYESNSFGDNGLYLDETGKWVSNDPMKMMFSVDKVAELDVSFSRALVITPENARFIAKAASKNDTGLTGAELANWARDEGYDGLIIRGFDKLQEKTVGPIPEDYFGEAGPTADGFKAFEDEIKAMGLREEIAQDQIFSFSTDNTKVVRDNLPPGTVIKTGMGDTAGQRAIPEPGRNAAETSPAGAQVSRTRNTLGAAPAPTKLRQAAMDAVGKFSPQYRMLTNRFFPSLRDGVAKLDMSGLMQGGLERVEPSAAGGMVNERIKGYDPHIVDFAKVIDREFVTYLYDGAKGIDESSPAIEQLKSTFVGTPPGKMNWAEFKAAIFDGQNTGKFEPALANAVQAFDRFFKYYTDRQKQYLDEFAQRGLDVEPLFKELADDELGEGAVNYAHHIFDSNKIIDKLSDFQQEFGDLFENQLNESFKKDLERYTKRKTKLEFEKQLNQLSPEALAQQLGDVANDLTFLEELPEWQAHRSARLDLIREARDNNWPKEQLKKQLKDLQDNAPQSVRDLQAERKRLMADRKLMQNLGADDTATIAKLEDAITKADDLIDGMFRLTIPRIQAIDVAVIKLQQQGDKAIKSATKDLAKVVSALDKRRAQMVKLLGSQRNNTASRQRISEYLDKLQLKYAGMQDRISMVNGQQLALDDRLSELNLLREDAIADTTSLVRARAAKLEDLEGKLEATKAQVRGPLDQQKLDAQIGEELFAHEQNFELKWGKRGAGGKAADGVVDFKERALEMATMLQQKLTNSEVELSPAYHALRQDARGAELLRVMKLPYEFKQKWLIKDVEVVTRAYDRVMAPDLELWRAFDGSVNAKSLLGEMQEEVTAHMIRIGTSNFVKLPAGWVDKAASFSAKVKDRLADFGESDELFLEAGNFSETAKEGYIPITPELRTQLARTVSDAAEAQTYNLDVAIQRLRATRGVPKNANSYWYRGGKFVKSMNVMTMMGSVIPSSVSDLARPIWQHGVAKVYRHGWSPFINRLNSGDKEYRIKSSEVNRRIGLNIEPTLHGRAQGIFDLADNSINRTKLERAVQLGSQKMGLIAGYDYWTAGMKVMAGNVTHAVMAEYIPAVAKSFRDGVEPVGDVLEMRTYLRSKGLRDLDIHRIALQMESPGGMEKFSNGGVLPNMGAWNDPSAYQAYQAAVLAEVNKLIVTPGLERPNIIDENMAYSMLFQFKSFVFASNSRMLMSNLQGTDPYLMQGITFSLAFGALSYYTYAVAAGGKTLDKANEGDPAHWAWEAVNRSGMLGVLASGGDIISEVPALNGDAPKPALFNKPTGLLGAVFGPTYSQATKMGEFIINMNTDDPKQQARNMRMLRQVWLPYQNHFILRRALDRVGDAMFGG